MTKDYLVLPRAVWAALPKERKIKQGMQWYMVQDDGTLRPIKLQG